MWFILECITSASKIYDLVTCLKGLLIQVYANIGKYISSRSISDAPAQLNNYNDLYCKSTIFGYVCWANIL